VPATRPAGDTGGADPAVTAALAAYTAGAATEHAVLTAIAASRLLVPVVAVLAEANADGTVPPAPPPAPASARSGSGSEPPAPASAHSGSRSEKQTEMALPTLIGNDGRKAVIAFTGTDTVRRWRADARPVPVPASRLWPAVAAEQADAVVIDVAGPVPLVVEGARLRALASGAPVPLPHEDPDIRAQVAAVTGNFTLGPGGQDAELTVTVKTQDLTAARAAAEAIAARLAPRLRRGIAFRIG
jgi:type III secretion system (T3SS) SseB-like protein